jgi:ribosomal-protein-alanine N-acetyltransferase
MKEKVVKKRKQEVSIRWILHRDIDEVLEIEKQSFPNPWGRIELMRCLRQRNNIGLVFTCYDLVTGYVIYEFGRSSIEIINLAVHPEYRRCSIGTLLIEKLQYKVDGQPKRNRLTALVRETNLPAQIFLRSNKFICDGIETDAYEFSDELGYSFVYRGQPNAE